MSYSKTVAIQLGASRTGLDLAAQLYNSAGVATGAEITTGFAEIGLGNYMLTLTLADGFQGVLSVYEDVADPTFSVVVAIEPRCVNAGSGADAVTVTITNTTTSLPVADADVWITSDSAGANVVAGTLQTNSQGDVTFLLDAGVTYYLWMQKDGVASILGQSFVAVAD